MATNAQLAQIFGEMAAAMELMNANPFKVNAYANAARVMSNLSKDAKELACNKASLLSISGIGQGIAAKIMEFCETGRIKEHEELLTQVPVGLIEVTRVPGVGSKTAKVLWEKAGVSSLQSLREAIAAGKLNGIPRFGEKKIQSIAQALDFADQSGNRMRLGEALPIAELIVGILREIKGTRQVEYAGSLRRGRDTIGDIDIVASSTSPGLLMEKFRSLPNVAAVLASGETKTTVRLAHGVQADLRVVPHESFGAAWMYFTGSKAHNVRLRERAQKKKLRLNEYGLFPDDGEESPPQTRGVKPVAGRTEQEVYKALGMEWIPPEVREGDGELERDVPALIEFDDIKAELHAHTVASDGALTIEELAAEAKRRGFHTIAVTDHSKASFQAGGLSPEKLLAHIEAIHEARQRVKGITILAGSEVDILPDGRLDYEDDLLAKLDIVIASPHALLKQDPEKATQRLLSAIRHPLVHIVGHPTGRLVNRREGLLPDIHKLIDAAVECDTALEINANSHRLDLRDIHVRAAVEAGALIAINTDAHTVADFDQLRYGVLTARRGWLTPAQCLNAWTKQKLCKWLGVNA